MFKLSIVTSLLTAFLYYAIKLAPIDPDGKEVIRIFTLVVGSGMTVFFFIFAIIREIYLISKERQKERKKFLKKGRKTS